MTMSGYIKVAEGESKENIELPIEEDGTLLLSTLESQFPGSTGLRYTNEGITRAVKLSDSRLYPLLDVGWESRIFYCVFPKETKRKADHDFEDSTSKMKRIEETRDLIVLGLSVLTTSHSLRFYFEKYGQVLTAEVKVNSTTGMSKGFGFVRFASLSSQKNVLATMRHLIDGTWCCVKISNKKNASKQQTTSKICFIFEEKVLTADDLLAYFSQYGEMLEVFTTGSGGVVKFARGDVARNIEGTTYIKGVPVHILEVVPKNLTNNVDLVQ